MRAYFQKGLIDLVDWDVLLVLDACRFDIFGMNISKTNLKGTLTLAHSMSEHTEAWYKNYWSEKHDDIILISANPHTRVSEKDKNFFMAYNIWEDENWIEPETALNKLIEIQDQFDKRFVIHLIPPHLPFIGEKGKKFIETLKIGETNMSIYRAVEAYGRKHGFKEIYEYYVESLLETLRIIEKYLPKIKGNVVITSDHGEFIGENGIYDHNYPAKEMYYVPWFEVS